MTKSARRALRTLLPWLPLLAAVLCGFGGPSAGQNPGAGGTPGKPPEAPASKPPVGEWQPLFDGKTLQGWKATPFTRPGEVSVKDGTIVLDTGFMTGITWTGWFPRSNYEVRFEAARMQGSDFFAALTFPVQKEHCTWINGGWGGGVVGLSSLDGQDASENETGSYLPFEKGRWYAFRLLVADDGIEAWIDNEQVISVATEGRTVGLRFGEIDLSAPFGFATYSTTGALRKIEYRLIEPPAPAPAPATPMLEAARPTG
jgi:hypothetical protein